MESLQVKPTGLHPERSLSPIPEVNPKPSAPYSWPLFVSVCFQGVVTAAAPWHLGLGFSSRAGRGASPSLLETVRWPGRNEGPAPVMHAPVPGNLASSELPAQAVYRDEGGNPPHVLDVKRTRAPWEAAKRVQGAGLIRPMPAEWRNTRTQKCQHSSSLPHSLVAP